MSTFKQIRAIALLPGTVTLVVPGIIIYGTGAVNLGWSLLPPLNLAPLALGFLLIGLGFFLWLQTTILFVTIGNGTLAPWDPTQKLVVRGIYRHVRNPMISGVGGLLLGEAILLGSSPLLYWFLFFMLLNMLYIPLLEEPGLAHRFGDDYLLYKKNVPRWIPRLKPWNAPMEIRGEKVTIRQTTESDLSDIKKLWNDGRVMKWVGFPDGLGYDEKKLKAWFERLQADSHRHHFVVRASEIGFCGEVYYEVDKAHQRAALDIKFVPEAQGQGLATDAFKTLIKFVFESEPEAEAVWTEPYEENAASQKLYARCGLTPKPRPADMEPGPLYWELRREAGGY